MEQLPVVLHAMPATGILGLPEEAYLVIAERLELRDRRGRGMRSPSPPPLLPQP